MPFEQGGVSSSILLMPSRWERQPFDAVAQLKAQRKTQQEPEPEPEPEPDREPKDDILLHHITFLEDSFLNEPIYGGEAGPISPTPLSAGPAAVAVMSRIAPCFNDGFSDIATTRVAAAMNKSLSPAFHPVSRFTHPPSCVTRENTPSILPLRPWLYPPQGLPPLQNRVLGALFPWENTMTPSLLSG